MSGVKWEDGEKKYLLKLVSKTSKDKINWKTICNKINLKFNNNRTDKSCLQNYYRINNKKDNTSSNKIKRWPRPIIKNKNKHNIFVINEEEELIFLCSVYTNDIEICNRLIELIERLK